MSEQTRGRLGWTALGVVALLAAGGAARVPDGIRLGVPALGLAMAVLTAVCFLAVRRPAGGRVLTGLLVVLGLLVLAPGTAAAGALSGPPLWAVVVAGLVASGADVTPLRRAYAPVIVLLYLLISIQVQRQVGPQGDEPHYLMVADSLLREGDLALGDDFREGRYASFFDGPLEPHYRVRGRHGEIYSLHALGLSLLVLPAYAAFGYPGVSFFMALLAALVAVLVRRLVRAIAGEGPTAELVAWLVALSPPLVHYAGLVFTEVPATLLVTFVLLDVTRRPDPTARQAMVVGVALGFLPWLNVRYAIVAVVAGLYWMSMRPSLRARAACLAPAILSAAALAAYHFLLYGFFDPRRVYGRTREFSLGTLKDGLPGLLLDQEFGLLVYAPIFVLAAPGLAWLVRHRPRFGVTASVLVAAVFLVAGTWPMWRGGFNPPARFLVPIVPVLAVAVAAWMRERRWAASALLAGWGVFAGLAGGLDPHLVHRDRDETAPLFRARSGATEWTRLLPGYVLSEPDRGRLALLWGLALGAAAIRGRTARGRTLAGALILFAGVAEVARRVSDAGAGGREATRLVRRTAFDWPAMRFGAGPALWTPADLGWGPVYEPHRHSGKAAIGERLRLPPGRYRIHVDGEPLGGASSSSPAGLRLVGRYGRPIGRAPCSLDGGSWSCELSVAPDTPEISLVLEGGGPWHVREIRLE